jgi:hypothetical protein
MFALETFCIRHKPTGLYVKNCKVVWQTVRKINKAFRSDTSLIEYLGTRPKVYVNRDSADGFISRLSCPEQFEVVTLKTTTQEL